MYPLNRSFQSALLASSRLADLHPDRAVLLVLPAEAPRVPLPARMLDEVPELDPVEGDLEDPPLPMPIPDKEPRRSRRTSRRARARTDPGPTPAEEPRWARTLLYGEQSREDAGQVDVVVRLQHDFRPKDISFEGTTEGAKARVTALFIGDQPVFVSSVGVPVETFERSRALWGLLRDWEGRAGLDIRVLALLAGPGQLAVTLTGDKPLTD